MTSYIVRRLLLMIPTILGILLVNFLIVQAAPGGPVEQVIAPASGTRGRCYGSRKCFRSHGRGCGLPRVRAGCHLLEVSRVSGGGPRAAPGVGTYLRLRPARPCSFLQDASRLSLVRIRRKFLSRPTGGRPGTGQTSRLHLPGSVEHTAHLRHLDSPWHRQSHSRRIPIRRVDVVGRRRRQCDSQFSVCRPARCFVCRRALPQLVSTAWSRVPGMGKLRRVPQGGRLPLAPGIAPLRSGGRGFRRFDVIDQEFIPRRNQQAVCDDGLRQGF